MKNKTTEASFFKQKITPPPQLFLNNYELSVIEKLTAIKCWSRMNELNVSIENIPGKLESYQKMINL